MTWVVNRVRTVDSIETNKVDAIINHLHHINFLNKDKTELEMSGLDSEYTTLYYLPGSKLFDYVTLKGPDDVMYYAYFEDESRNDPEKFCRIEVNYEDDCDGNNVIALSYCGDPFKDYSGLINELEKVTGDKYISTEKWY